MASTTTYHLGGFTPASVAQNKSEEWNGTLSTYTQWNVAGLVLVTRPLTATETATLAAVDADRSRDVNSTTIRTQAANALANNRAYLALTAPVAADNLAQIKALTRQNNALIRIALGMLDGTD